eukprot:CAMPEP_0197072464 /NCGR_PEP_ID=MMETSP1384-20130603/210107_1 /TAXON_ID=29189 /ORGANISM="Ammonia sp." /LENGTH=299 /DNA_ID=CAMNT_0042511283 /DNA_START=836 /DNA_END=1735 /DNA_ORIENTATION=+
MLSQFQMDENATSSRSGQIEPDVPSSNVLNDGSQHFNALNIVSNSTLILNELFNEMPAAGTDRDAPDDHDHHSANGSMRGDDDNVTLMIGTVMAMVLWIAVYVSSPQLFRLTGCFVWCSIFWFLANLYFHDNESVQRAVFSLFGFSPIFIALYLHDRSQRLLHGHLDEAAKDIHSALQFLCLFACIAYFALIFSPLDMYLFLVHDFLALSLFERAVSVFLALSIAAFAVLLAKHCQFIATLLCRKHVSMDKALCTDRDSHHRVDEHDVFANQVQSALVAPSKKKRRRRRRAKKQQNNSN